MRGNTPLFPASRCRGNHVAERNLAGDASEPPSLPFAQIVLDPSFTRFPEQPPRLPSGTGHDGHAIEFVVGILRAVTPPKGLYQSNNLATLLKSAFHERKVNKVREKRIGRDKQVSAGNENAESALREV